MWFQFSCLSSTLVLSLLSAPFCYAMDYENDKALSRSQSLTKTNVEEQKHPTIGDLRGFQPHYKTLITTEEWNNAKEKLTQAASAVTTCDVISVWVNMYRNACPAYFNLYKDLSKQNLKKLNEEKLLAPLFDFTAALVLLMDNIRTDYRQVGRGDDYIRLESEVLPILQPTFNQYMKAYETLTGKVTSSIGSLDYEKEVVTLKTHLFYQRDRNGFLPFNINIESSTLVDPGLNLYMTYIPYTLPSGFEHLSEGDILFTLDKNGKPTIERKSGLLFKKKQPTSESEQLKEFVLLTFYYGAEHPIHPFNFSKTLAVHEPQPQPIQPVSLNPEQFHFQDPLSMHKKLDKYFDKEAKIDHNHAVWLEDSQHRFLFQFGQSFLEDNPFAFLPYPSIGIEELEAEYLFLSDFKEKISKGIQPEDTYLLEYLKEGFPEQTPEEVIANYEGTLLGAYEDEETRLYNEQIRKEQEENKKKVVNNEHYKPQNKKDKKNKKLNVLRNKNPIEIEDKTLSNSKENQIHMHSQKKAQERLNQLKENVTLRKKPEKFRKFLKAVNMATQGLARLNVPVEAELHKSSHGNIAVDKEKPITIVRPHGLRDTISKKNGKGILTNLLSSYIEKLGPKKECDTEF